MVKSITVVTDSTACLTKEMAQEFQIEVLPIWVIFGENAYRDGIDITPEEFYERLAHVDQLPKTSSPSPGEYLSVFKKLIQQSQSILVITYSSRYGMSYQAAKIAQEMMGEASIYVLDSGTATMAQGFIVLIAARAALMGVDFAEVVSLAIETKNRVGFLAELESLEFLRQSGRVPEIANWLGRALRLRLLFGSCNGNIEVIGASRTRRQAVNQMLDELRDRTENKKLDIATFHAQAPGEVSDLEIKLLAEFKVDEFYRVELTPVIGAHIGPGVIGLAYCLDNPLYNPRNSSYQRPLS